MTKIKFLKVRNVKTPSRGTSLSAGIDFYVPNYSADFLADLKDKNIKSNCRFHKHSNPDAPNGVALQIVIPPHCRILIPSGIKAYMEDQNCALIAANKSGVCTKKGLVFGAQVVDADYSGEIHISVINSSNSDVYIESGDKLIQFIQTPVVYSEIEEILSNDIEEQFENLHKGTERGAGGFGSTGTK